MKEIQLNGEDWKRHLKKNVKMYFHNREKFTDDDAVRKTFNLSCNEIISESIRPSYIPPNPLIRCITFDLPVLAVTDSRL